VVVVEVGRFLEQNHFAQEGLPHNFQHLVMGTEVMVMVMEPHSKTQEAVVVRVELRMEILEQEMMDYLTV
jgi:hypothetical protein